MHYFFKLHINCIDIHLLAKGVCLSNGGKENYNLTPPTAVNLVDGGGGKMFLFE